MYVLFWIPLQSRVPVTWLQISFQFRRCRSCHSWHKELCTHILLSLPFLVCLLDVPLHSFPSCQVPKKLSTSFCWWRPLIEVETSSFSNNFGCVWWYRSKIAKMQKFPIDSHSNENFISPFFCLPGAANPQRGRRHIRNQNTPACETWLESARGLSRNRWPNKQTNKQKTYSKTNTSPFAQRANGR